MYSGHFKGASFACDSTVREKALGVTQTGPFTFVAFAPPSAPVLGEAVCPSDPSFRRTLLIENLTTFSLPPSCEMSLDRFQLYSADRSFIRQGTGTSFSYPFPADLIRGNISQPELEAVKSYLTVARTLAKETRLEAWKRAREMRSIMSNVGYESYLSLLLGDLLRRHLSCHCRALVPTVQTAQPHLYSRGTRPTSGHPATATLAPPRNLSICQ